MGKEGQATKQNEMEKYHDNLPQEIVGELTPEVRRQYFLWDEIFKREIELYPWMVLPLIREIFGKEYPAKTKIKLLSTEYVASRVYGQGERLIESIHSDLLIQVGRRDIYHMECQMKEGGNIAVRMLEYDMNIALVHGIRRGESNRNRQDGEFTLNFPQSAILYLNNTKNTPDVESCIVNYPDGTKYKYSVPVLKVQNYTPQMAAEKHLYLLLPFFPIRFKNRFDAIRRKDDSALKEKVQKKMSVLKNNLTKLVEDCIMILNRAEENGTLSGRVGTDILELIGKTCDYLFKEEPGLLGEVHEVMEPAIKLMREELEERIAEQQGQIAEQKGLLAQKDKQLEQNSQNYIQQCKEEGKSRSETEQMLQKVLSLNLPESKEKLEKYW